MDSHYMKKEEVRKRREKVAILYSKGLSRRQIALEVGIPSIDIIHADIAYLIKNGIVEKQGPSTREKNQKIKARREKVAELWENGENFKQIAEELGVAVSMINSDIRALLRNRKISPHKKELPELVKRRKKVVDLYNNGKSIKEIARKLGVSIVTIKRDINYLRVKGIIEIEPDVEPKISKYENSDSVNEVQKSKTKVSARLAHKKYYSMMIEHILDLYKKGDIDEAIQYLESLANEMNLQGEVNEKLQEIMDILQSRQENSDKHIVIEAKERDERIFSERVENLYYTKLSVQEIARILKSSVQEVEDKIAELKERKIIQEDEEYKDEEER